jgi:uncharacterized membrane protein HdeD (DUF308 family)
MERNSKFDWISFLLGIILIVISIFVLKNPTAIILKLTNLLGIIAIVRGVMLIVFYYRVKEQTSFQLKFSLLNGVLFVAIGTIFLAWPAFVVRVFAYLVAIWFIIDAIDNIVNSNLIRPAGKGIYVLYIICSILLLTGGIILLLHPLIVGLPISLFIGLSLMLSGIEYIISAFFNPMFLGY